MKFLLRCAMPTLLLAAILHLAAIWFGPELMSSIVVRMFQKSANLGWNQFSYGSLLEADGGVSSAAASPDIIYSMAFYDVTKGPVRLHCAIPATGNYWSISLYAWNAENFFVENDRTIPLREFDLILMRPGTNYRSRTGELSIVDCE